MNNGRLTLLAVGDVGPIHEPVESYSVLARPALRGADLRFAQVERVYSERGSLQLHAGSGHSRVKPALASVFEDCGFDVVSVASNHAMDWGPEAMLDSIECLRGKGLATVGAGRDLEEARKPVFIERNGVRIGFLAYCTVLHEGYAAEQNKPGVAPLRAHTYYQAVDYQAGVPPRTVTVAYEDDLRNLLDDVTQARKHAQAVVVSLHWGIHFIPKMLADYQKVVAKAAFGAGADVILGHHAHVPKGIESRDGKACFYSLSNFIMSANEMNAHQARVFKQRYGAELDPDYPRLPYGRDAKRSMIAKAVFGASGLEQVSFLPVLIDTQLRPEVLSHADPRFQDAIEYMERASEDLPHSFTVAGDEVVVGSAAT
ncbi:MAG: CapA family protein [Burkholderiales bacterium]|nr:CapA family protein [Burkholderiales bacterium]